MQHNLGHGPTGKPGQSVTFNWDVRAPVLPSAWFSWKMVRDGVEWFGQTTPPVKVTIDEPPECQGLRDGIRGAEGTVKALQTILQTAPAGGKAAILSAIKKQ